MDTKYILSFDIKEQLKMVIQKMHEVKQRASPHFAAASCERDSTRQKGLITIY